MDNRPVKVKIDNVKKVYEGKNGKRTVALNGVSLDIKENEFVCIVGPSGCGKSTLLNIVAGLFPSTSGTVTCNGKLVEGTGVDRGVVFQQYALFPWLTVRKNIEFGLSINKVPDPNGTPVDPVKWRESEEKKLRKDLKYTVITENGADRKLTNEEIELRVKEYFEKTPVPQPMRKLTKKEIQETADKYIKLVQLEDFANAHPKELSGGMKQRVAIARAYAVNPAILLLDEPFGALDAQTRTQLQSELLDTWQKERKTCMFITHDIEEAIILAERIVIMSARPGRIKEIVNVDIPYPRDQKTKMSDEFLKLKNYIWGQVYEEYLAVRK